MEIEILSGLETIRRRPHLYLGDLGRENLFDDLILEALCHAIDEAMESNCHDILIQIRAAGVILVQYDAGINLELNSTSGKRLADILLTELQACHNLKKHLEVGSKYCQYGLAVLNALCAKFQVETVWKGECGTQVYIEGKADRNFEIVPSDHNDQTIFHFSFDKELLGEHDVHLDYIQSKLKEIDQVLRLKLNIICSSIVPALIYD
jgi:DNA gyrase/topoisomerase IV subunit B